MPETDRAFPAELASKSFYVQKASRPNLELTPCASKVLKLQQSHDVRFVTLYFPEQYTAILKFAQVNYYITGVYN